MGPCCLEIFVFIKGILSRVNTRFQVQYFKAYIICRGQLSNSNLLVFKVVISHSHQQKMGESANPTIREGAHLFYISLFQRGRRH